ncbi:MAG: DUF1326 domain-containing protein [Verrucomicrobiota bacterium]|jgi:hypothetical protein
MNLKATALLMLTAATLCAAPPAASRISGHYLEVRSCDIYTGPCFANAEMGLTGKEAILVWSVREGAWNGTDLHGLSVIAVVRTDDTLGDLRYQPRSGKAVVIVDAKANTTQAAALNEFVRSMAGKLIQEVVETKSAPMDITLGNCKGGTCATVKAGGLVEVSTRCLGNNDHVCGNEEVFYPPLTPVKEAVPALTEIATYTGSGLNMTWQAVEKRSAFLASFAL